MKKINASNIIVGTNFAFLIKQIFTDLGKLMDSITYLMRQFVGDHPGR